MRKLLTLAIILFATPALAQSGTQGAPKMADITDLPAGSYASDPAHTSVIFRVLHMGLSHYTARFTKVTETVQLDPKKPEASSVVATIDVASLQTNYPDPAKVDFDKELTSADWLNAGQYPVMTFKSTQLTRIGGNRGRLTGDLTLHGVTKPVVLEVTMNGAYVKAPMMGNPAMGFSARGTIRRIDFGLSKGIPMVGDEVAIEIETELHKAD